MFQYEILRNRWVILMLFTGLVLLLIIALFFLDYFTPRKVSEEKPDEYETHLSAWEGIPWGLKAVIGIILIFAVSYSIYAIIHPNSW